MTPESAALLPSKMDTCPENVGPVDPIAAMFEAAALIEAARVLLQIAPELPVTEPVNILRAAGLALFELSRRIERDPSLAHADQFAAMTVDAAMATGIWADKIEAEGLNPAAELAPLAARVRLIAAGMVRRQGCSVL